jgi:hypothetical protein
MKTFLVLVSCIALSAFAYGQGGTPDKNKKKSEQTAEATQKGPAPKAYGAATRGGPPRYAPAQSGHNVGIGQGFRRSTPTTTKSYGGPDTKTKALGSPDTRPGGKRSIGGPGDRDMTKRSTATAGATAKTSTGGAKTFSPRRFNLASKAKPAAAKAPAVTFRQGTRIQGSQNWTGSRYTAFRSYSPQWHDRGWWHSHHDRIVFVFGGWYYWNTGYWYPAWGYDPYAYYFYDGPIYAYNDLPPDQVIANVQAALQQQGYYEGEVDGLLGPLTRAAIANYQQDHGLYITSAIDEPTLASLGMV